MASQAEHLDTGYAWKELQGTIKINGRAFIIASLSCTLQNDQFWGVRYILDRAGGRRPRGGRAGRSRGHHRGASGLREQSQAVADTVEERAAEVKGLAEEARKQ